MSGRLSVAWIFLSTIRKTERDNLCAMGSVEMKPGQKWETLACIVDSGASIPVQHPTFAKAYPLMESESSKNGDEYEIANGDPIPCLGSNNIAVLTTEGTLRGYGSQ